MGMIKLTSWAVFGGYAGQFPTTASSIASVVTHNSLFYMEVFVRIFGVPGTAIIAASTVFFFIDLAIRRPTSLGAHFHLAWMLTGVALCAAAHRYSDRYLFFVLPAPILIGFLGSMRLLQMSLPARRYSYFLSIAIPFAAFAYHFQYDACYLSGPAEVAKLVSETSPKRILYCGWTDGTFILALRGMNSESTVIRGDKLPKEFFAPDELEAFVREFGVDYVVIENAPINDKSHLPVDHGHEGATLLVPSMFPNLAWRPWYDLPLTKSVANMRLVAEISQVCHPYTNVSGTLFVYQNKNKAPTPKSRLEIWAPRINGNLILELP
jgi:hypothetical protein